MLTIAYYDANLLTSLVNALKQSAKQETNVIYYTVILQRIVLPRFQIPTTG